MRFFLFAVVMCVFLGAGFSRRLAFEEESKQPFRRSAGLLPPLSAVDKTSQAVSQSVQKAVSINGEGNHASSLVDVTGVQAAVAAKDVAKGLGVPISALSSGIQGAPLLG